MTGMFGKIKRRLSLIGLIGLLSLNTLSAARAAPLAQQGIAVITSPSDGQTVSGLVRVTGSSNHPDFDRFELAYGPDPNPNDAWQVFSTGTQPVDNNVLGLWDTTRLPDGTWALRLRTVRKDSNYDEVVVRGLQVINSRPVDTPTPAAPEPTFPPAPTFDAAAGSEATPAPLVTVPVELPPTRAPVVDSGTPGAAVQPTRRASSPAGALFDAGGAATACLNGVLVAGLAFSVVGAIQLGRRTYKEYLRARRRRH